MSATPVTIKAHGVLDHSRAETLAARMRAAVRNGKRAITIVLGSDTVIASPAFLAFLLRAGAVLGRDGGRLTLEGDQSVLDQLAALGIPAALAAHAAATPGAQA